MNQKKQTFIEKVKSTIAKRSMLSGGETVLVGLSGGPDSVCLLHVLSRLKEEISLTIHALYVDHGLRPLETPSEIAFCRKLCDGLPVPFTTKAIEVKTYAKEQGLNKQDAARELRYRALNEGLYEIHGQKIALGHSADDQLETFLMRFMRGAGPKGLSGIPPVRRNIIRPLIETERREIEEFLGKERIDFIVDSSNLMTDYLRNRTRQVIVPELKEINPVVVKATSRMMDILREEEDYFAIIVTKTLMKLICRKTDLRIELFLAPLEAMEKVILRRVLRRAIDETKGIRGIEFVHIEDIIDLIKKGRHGDRLCLPKGLRVIKSYATLVLTSEIPQKLGTYPLVAPCEVVMREIGSVIRASTADPVGNYGDGKMTAVFDADKSGATLTVRSRREGDFFYPTGFGKRKKLQDFFVDEKVPRDERDAVPIVVSGDDIVWVAGFRGDERFKVSESTRRFLKLEIKKAL